ncbi:MAG TPA: sigma-E processing peptidase SpoIIGA [Bacilli bacterium]|nr:sigma-E processing peptidase SpoIIGA [Bacilli bacterium]
MPVVYIDVVWLINFGLDGFILLVTWFLLRKRVRWWRTIGASAIGASYALLLFFPAWSTLLTFAAKIGFSCLMVWVAFRPKGLLELAKTLGLFYLASFLTGGAAFAMNNLFGNATIHNGLVMIHGGAAWLQQTNMILILLSLPLVYWLGKSAWKRLARTRQREQNLWTVQVRFGEEEAEFTGLLDTGNALSDPLSRTPVMVADWELFRAVLPPTLWGILEQGKDISTALGEIEMDDQWQARFRLVPYRGVGGTMGMLLSFRPDEVVLTGQGQGEAQSCRRILIGLNPKPLAADGSYRAILHPAMLEARSDEPDREAS